MKKFEAKDVCHLGLILILIFLGVFIWIYGTNLTLGYTDTAYHLATAQGFSRAGGIVFWDFWESLPLGRPHLYPPLFHIVLATFLKAGFSPLFSAKLMMEFATIGGLSIFAWGVRKLFNIKVAFWAVFFLAMSVNFIRLSTTVMPAAVILFLTPALFYFLKSKKWIGYVCLLTFIFYLHMFIPYLIAFTILLYLLLFDRKNIFKAVLASLIAFVFYLPWLIHILAGGIEYIKYFDSNYSFDRWTKFADVNLLMLALVIAGIFCGIKRLKNEEKAAFLFFLLLFITTSIVSFFASNRTINGHLLVPSAVIGGIFLTNLSVRRWPFYLFVGLSFAYILYTPYFRFQNAGSFFFMEQSPLSTMANPGWYEHKNWEKVYARLISGLDEARPGSSLVSLMENFNNLPVEQKYQVHISNYLQGYSSVSTLNLYDPEVHHRPAPDLLKSDYLLTNIPTSEIDSSRLYGLGYSDPELPAQLKQNFTTVSSVPMDDYTYYLLKNVRTDTTSEKIPEKRLPMWLADLIIIGFIVLIALDNKRTLLERYPRFKKSPSV